MRTRLLPPALLAATVVLAACGGGSSSDSTVPADTDVVVTAIEGIKWDAADYTATAGEVSFAVKNSSSLPHNLHVLDASNADLGMKLDIPTRGDIATGSLTLQAGTYTLICTIPGHANMKATLTVN